MAHFGSSRPPRELGKRSHRDDEDGQAADTAEKQQETPKLNKITGNHQVYSVPCIFKEVVYQRQSDGRQIFLKRWRVVDR